MYISEFFKELNEQLNEKSDENETNKDICLISMEKLEENHITLPCSHKFNYLPLFHEVKRQKSKQYVWNQYDPVRLKINEIKLKRLGISKSLIKLIKDVIIEGHSLKKIKLSIKDKKYFKILEDWAKKSNIT